MAEMHRDEVRKVIFQEFPFPLPSAIEITFGAISSDCVEIASVNLLVGGIPILHFNKPQPIRSFEKLAIDIPEKIQVQ